MTHIVETIPDEILELIFNDCCNTNLFSIADDYIMSSLGDLPALTVSSVCLQWRRVGLSSSRIWSRISLEHWGDYSFTEDRRLEYRLSTVLKTFISRSRQQPLVLSICFDDSPTPDIWRPYEPLAILCGEYQRWSSFTFQSATWFVSDLFRSINSPLQVDTFPTLVDLHLPLDENLSFLNVRAPRLQRLTINSWPSYSTVMQEMPSLSPLAQLNHVRLEQIWSIVVMGTLSELTALRSLDVDDFDESGDGYDLIWLSILYDDFKTVPPTTCPSIEALNVRHHENGTSDSIFPFLTLPSLKTLRLDCGQEFVERQYLWRSFNPFMGFVKRSSFPLTTLCIKGVAFSDSRLIYLLYHIPTLLDLAVMDPIVIDGEKRQRLIPITGRFLQSLHVGTGSLLQPATPLVPRLSCLTLSVGECLFSATEASDLVKSRLTNGSQFGVDCLQSLTIVFRGRMKVPKVYDALNGFKKDGIKITILCSNSATEFFPTEFFPITRTEYQ